MKLWAGRNPNIGTEVIFNIFDLLPGQYEDKSGGSISVSQYDITIPGDNPRNFKTLYFDKTDTTFLPFLFPADIPRQCTDEGNIIMVSGGMTYDETLQAYAITDTNFETITGGDEPDDWKTARFEYYYKFANDPFYAGFSYQRCTNCRTNETTQANYNYVYAFDTTIGTPYDSSAVYYHNNNIDPRKNLCQLYTAATGSSFGIWRNFTGLGTAGCGIGNIYTENNSTIYTNYGEQTPFFYAPFGQNPYSYYHGKNIKHLYLSEDKVSTAGGYKPISQSSSITIFVSYVYDDVQYYGMALITMSDVSADAYPVRIQAQLFSEEYWGESIISGGSSGGEWGPSSVIDGGNGSFSATSDPHGTGDPDDVQDELSTTISALTNVFGGNGGFNIHEILPAAISDVLSVLYSTNFLTRYAQAMYDPMSAILSMHLIPANLIKFKQTSSKITASGYDISANMPSGAATTIFPEVIPETVYHVGTIDIGNFFGAFPDYAPYTECILHLPYIGTIKIDTNAIMYGKLAVYYACDAATGNVCAWVWCRDRDENRRNYKYLATGNAAYTIPVAARNNNGLDAGKLLGNVASAVFMGAMGNTLGAGLSAIRAGFQANPFLMPKSTIVEGTFGGNASTLENSMCFLEIIRPEWVQPESYPDDMGIPTFITGTIAELGAAGYIEIEEIDIEILAATDTEKEELRKILYDGFWYMPAE